MPSHFGPIDSASGNPGGEKSRSYALRIRGGQMRRQAKREMTALREMRVTIPIQGVTQPPAHPLSPVLPVCKQIQYRRCGREPGSESGIQRYAVRADIHVRFTWASQGDWSNEDLYTSHTGGKAHDATQLVVPFTHPGTSPTAFCANFPDLVAFPCSCPDFARPGSPEVLLEHRDFHKSGATVLDDVEREKADLVSSPREIEELPSGKNVPSAVNSLNSRAEALSISIL